MAVALNMFLDKFTNVRFVDGFEPVEEGLFTRGTRQLEVEFDLA